MSKTSPVAIVTGASSGIGLAITKALLEHGYRVVGTSRSATKSKDLQAGEKLELIDGDVGKKETAVKVVSAAMAKFGRVDTLINNAGIFISKPFPEYTEEDFQLLIGTNMASFFYMTQQVIPHMQKQKTGHVLSISTTLTDQPLAGVPCGLQVMTKASLPSASRALSIEYAGENIRFNVISPGVVDTPMHDPGSREALKKLSPLGRLADTKEIVEAVFFLESAGFVSGENLRIDGGAHAGKW